METGIAKAIRLAKGQSALSRMIDRTPQCVQRWYAAGRPSLEGGKRIVKALPGQITLSELFPETSAPDGA